jgi:type IV pilus assembly protein PilQ
MRYFGAQVLRFFAIISIALICSKCAGQGPLGSGTGIGQPASVQGRSPDIPESPIAKGNRADQILDLRVDESPEATLVRITGNASLQDYGFRRSGENKFALDLNGIKPGGALNLLPISSEQLTLTDGGAPFPRPVQLLGSLRKPLDYYVLDIVGNELILTLYLGKDSRASAGSQPPPVGGSASKKSPGMDQVTSAQGSSELARPVQSIPSRNLQIAPGLMTPRPPVGSRMQSEISKKQYTGKPISLDLLDADLKNVLRLLADITGTNIVLEPDVSGRVTIKVEKVPWDQVLDMVLAMNDLGKEEIGSVIRIARLGKLKQEWNQQVDQIRAKQELLEVSKDIGTITTAYLTVNYAQPVEIAAKISEIKSERGKLSVDERSSLVIYSDYPNRIEAAKNLLGRLDRATAQVMIEARIVTANRDATKALGTDWSLRFQKAALPLLPDTPAAGTRTFQINHPADPLLGFSIASLWGDTLASIDFKLSALETASQVNIVAAPKVLTINNVKAVISQGQQIPYLVRSDYGSSSTQFKDAVVELQVTPHITPDQKVRLEIQAKQDEPTVKDYQVGDSSVPGIETRKITTELLVDDGQVIVIGGVMRGREEESNRGTPGLNKIPLLGWLFKTETSASQKTELLIFISPQIVDPTGARPSSWGG